MIFDEKLNIFEWGTQSIVVVLPLHSLIFTKIYRKFNELAVELLDQTHKTDTIQARLLLTYDLEYWGHETCLSLAMISNNKKLLAHSR